MTLWFLDSPSRQGECAVDDGDAVVTGELICTEVAREGDCRHRAAGENVKSVVSSMSRRWIIKTCQSSSKWGRMSGNN